MAITDLLQALKGERLSSVFSPDGTLISASAAPHCGDQQQQQKMCLLSPLNTQQSHTNLIVHNPFNVCSNHTTSKLQRTLVN